MKLSCKLWGHHVHNDRLAAIGDGERHCRCGEAYLSRDGSLTRVRHTLSCFLGHHTYTPLTERDGCHEYVCVQCGHPLVFRDGHDPYRAVKGFTKKVRYLCGLFGHRVASVTERDGWVEYACHCGHTFLKQEHAISTIRHPMVCVLLGHYVRYVTSRRAFDEFVCVTCGHPFCFARESKASSASAASTTAAGATARPRRSSHDVCASEAGKETRSQAA